ncbi:alpha-1,2-fucosyltransferase [Bacteroides sp. HPS0048]|uniref:alpha-1,2-fucosyltransferase n=1 Tax=Bacteroides sp. HPS0048 TaxID=1078089 RepID=UPI003569F71C
MFIISLSGGIGNQLFQYTFGKYLEKKYNQIVCFDRSSIYTNSERRFELNILDEAMSFYTGTLFTKYSGIRRRILRLLFSLNRNNIIITECNISQIEKVDIHRKKVLIIGYWQDMSLVLSVFSKISFSFTPLLPIPHSLLSFKENIQSTNSVFIHVRRGDYFSPLYVHRYGICTVKYYLDAIQYIRDHISNPSFFVFSDDVDWVKDNLGSDCSMQYVENSININSYYYIYLMSLCKHSIISNSSFSWWGAFINNSSNKIVVTPDKWENGTKKHLALENWIKLPTQ